MIFEHLVRVHETHIKVRIASEVSGLKIIQESNEVLISR